jgi:hypothetical protein
MTKELFAVPRTMAEDKSFNELFGVRVEIASHPLRGLKPALRDYWLSKTITWRHGTWSR